MYELSVEGSRLYLKCGVELEKSERLVCSAKASY